MHRAIQKRIGKNLHNNFTLGYRIIMQDGIKVQDGKISKTNKHAGWNKSMQVALFSFFIGENKAFWAKIPKIDKSAGWNKSVQVRLYQKINKVCCMNIRYSKVQCLAKKLEFLANPLVKWLFSGEGCMPQMFWQALNYLAQMIGRLMFPKYCCIFLYFKWLWNCTLSNFE